MSRLGKWLLSISVVLLIVIGLTSFILSAWLPILTILLLVCFLFLLISVVVDYRFYLSILLLRTTKNGMTIGAGVLVAVVFCSALAYLSKRYSFSFDITEEKLHTLSTQTTSLLNSLQGDMSILVFYKGAKGSQKKEGVKQSLYLFQQKSKRLKVRYYDAYLKNKLAQEYLNPEAALESPEDVFVFVEYQGKKTLVAPPFDEEKITSAMIKATRREEKTLYFLSGHGERDINSDQGVGLSELKTALVNSSFKVKSWSFVKDGPLPQDVSALIIIGPKKNYLPKELKWIEQYVDSGGSLLIALDPEQRSNLSKVLKTYGVQFNPAMYITDRVSEVVGLGAFSPMGVYFDSGHPITRSFQKGLWALFHLASPLEVGKVKEGWTVTELVRTNPQSLAVLGLDTTEGKRNSHTVALLVQKAPKKPDIPSHIPLEEADKEEVADKNKSQKDQGPSKNLVVFGDSDFLSNNFIHKGVANRDLVLNTISYLVDEKDLVSIRPKRLKATQLTLTRYDQVGLLIFALALPILFFVASFVAWFRRRSA